MTRSAGIDIGSRTTKLVIVENNELVHSCTRQNSFDPLRDCRELLKDIKYDTVVATGYGRHLFKEYFDSDVISEISAFARGASWLVPSCRTIIDIGGQDTKTISVDDKGKIKKFEMNDKCAAGTGRFLEIMASALGYTMNDFIHSALSATGAEKINSMCTVFAESEVISMAARGASRPDVALGIHLSITRRAIAMLNRIVPVDDIVFAGGVALNSCMRRLMEKQLGTRIIVPDDPQIVGALGCALTN